MAKDNMHFQFGTLIFLEQQDSPDDSKKSIGYHCLMHSYEHESKDIKENTKDVCLLLQKLLWIFLESNGQGYVQSELHSVSLGNQYSLLAQHSPEHWDTGNH